VQIVEDCEERFSGEQLDTLLELIETHLGSSRPDQGEKGGSEDEDDEGGEEGGEAEGEGMDGEGEA
jgi:hypothetical protein